MNQKLQKTKKWLSIVLVAVMVLTAAPLAGFTGISFAGADLALFASAEEVPTSGTWGDNLTWSIDGDVLTISGEGAMQDMDLDGDIFPEWFYHYETIRSIVLEEGITSIGMNAFINLSALSQVSIPSSVTSIGDYAFALSALAEITIPGSVTSIGEYAFGECLSLTDVTIENGVTSIGEGAFYNCSALTTVTIPDSVTSIGAYAFSYCSLLAEITVSAGTIGDYAFARCFALESAEIGNGVTSIGESAFIYCTALEDITIGNGVKSIGSTAFYNTAYYNNESNWENGILYIGSYLIDVNSSLEGAYTVKEGTKVIATYAFESCYNLTDITIPDSVTGIGSSAFANCSKLTSISFGTNSKLESIGEYAFNSCSALTEIALPASVTQVSGKAFQTASKLANIHVEAGNTAFVSENGVLYNKDKTVIVKYPNGKKDATSFAIPDTVTTIGHSAFINCSTLRNITIPAGLTSIEAYAFAGSGVSSVCVPDAVTDIPDSAFEKCYYLQSVTFGADSKLTNIGYKAFYNCTGITSIAIPDGVTAFGDYAFYGCNYLDTITFGAESKLTSIGESAFYYCERLTGIDIPDTVTTIGEDAFGNCTYLTSVSLPASLAAINRGTFYYCSRLESITIPENVTSVAYDAFEKSGVTAISVDANNTALSAEDGILYSKDKTVLYLSLPCDSVVVESCVTEIAERAFYRSSVTKVTILNPDCTMGNNCIPSSAVMFGYADSTAQAYAEANGNEFNAWTGTDEIPSDAIAFGTYGDNLSWVLDKDGVLTISGTGEMKASDEEEYPAWLNYGPEIKSVVIADGITNIDATAFSYCTALEKITIPDSVTTIGESAFALCSSLTEIAIPGNVTSIGAGAFYGCSALTKITLPDGVTTIGESAFASCSSLTEIAIPGNVTSIGAGAFYGCSALTEITIPASVTSIAVNAFEDCTSLVSINVDENNANYSTYDGVLYNKDKTVLLRHPQGKKDDSFVFLPSVTTIGEYAFYGCDVCTTTEKQTIQGYGTFYIYYLNVPYTVTSVGENAFDSIIIPGGNYCFYYIEFYNPNCEIYDSASTIKKSDFLLIGGYDGSTAQAYATKYNRTFASLGAMPEDHTPAALIRENEVVATCTTEGSYDLVVYCADEGCNKELHRATVKVKALGHSFTNYEPSAADPNVEIAYCDNQCGATDERKVAVHEHAAYSSAKENEVAATCEENGSYDLITYCVCGEEISRETVTESALGHSFTQYEQTVAPDCENEGKEVAVCDNGCKTENERTVAALGHDPLEAVKENIVGADCVNAGSYDLVVYCDVCGDELERTPVTGEALGHTPAEAVKENEVDADCVNDGSYDLVVYCDVCGEEISRETVTTDALGHTPLDAVKENEVAATCEKGGSYDLVVYCDVCGDEISRETVTTDALGHTPLDAVKENEVAATCEKGGSYDLVVYCDVCGDEISREAVTTDALGHSFTKYAQTEAPDCENEGKEVASCDNGCGETDEREVAALGHAFTAYTIILAPTCDEEGLQTAACDRNCGATDEQIIPALGHSFTNYESNGDATCMSDGTKTAVCDYGCGAEDTVIDKGSMLEHIDMDEDKICDDCGSEIKEEKCICACHQRDLINKIFTKIVNLLRRMLGINYSCDCGAVHTEGLTLIWKRIGLF